MLKTSFRKQTVSTPRLINEALCSTWSPKLTRVTTSNVFNMSPTHFFNRHRPQHMFKTQGRYPKCLLVWGINMFKASSQMAPTMKSHDLLFRFGGTVTKTRLWGSGLHLQCWQRHSCNAYEGPDGLHYNMPRPSNVRIATTGAECRMFRSSRHELQHRSVARHLGYMHTCDSTNMFHAPCSRSSVERYGATKMGEVLADTATPMGQVQFR